MAAEGIYTQLRFEWVNADCACKRVRETFPLLIHVGNVFLLGLEGIVGAMWKATALLALLALCPCGDGLFRSIYNSARVSLPPKGNAGQPLFLTPYIEAGKVKQGKSNQETTGALSAVLFLFKKKKKSVIL